MSLLSIVSASMLRQNLAAPPGVIGSSDTGVQQRLALLQDIGDELAERVQWAALNIAATIVGTGAQTLFPIPADFGGLSNGLQFQSTLYPMLPIFGPVTNEKLASLKAFPVTPIQPVWRPIQGNFEFWPAPAAGEIYTYNYYSPNWVRRASTGLAVPAWTADADTSLIDEKVLATGLEYRWRKAKGFDFELEMKRFEDRIARADGRDDDSRTVSMSRKIIGGNNIWPGLIPIYGDGGFDSGFDAGFD